MESNQNVTDQSDTRKRIEQLVAALNQASQAYYNGQDEIMSNYEWDQMFDELQMLEKETGYVMPESPTQNTKKREEKKKPMNIRHFPWLRPNRYQNFRNGQKISQYGSPGNWMV